MNVASWNVRGLNKASHQMEVINFIVSNQVSFMCCMETKVKSEQAEKISKKINNRWSWVFNYNHHSNGRLWVGWDSAVWHLTVVSSSDQHITCNVIFLAKQVSFVVTFVYALNKPHQRNSLWNDILRLSTGFTVPWCITGDFNSVIHLNEIQGGREHWTPDMQSFKDCVQTAGLGHIKTMGDKFTWYNNRPEDPIFKRLDRMLANKEWFASFTDSLVFVKHRGIMDHAPLILTVPMTLQRLKKQFQFFNFMVEIPEFQASVRQAWSQPSGSGDPMIILQRKLQKVKQAMVALNKAFGNAHSNVTAARLNLEEVQQRLSATQLDPALRLEEKTAVFSLEQALKIEEQLLLQKSRTKWLSLGDGNNSFFFNQVKANWHHNKILAIQNDQGVVVTGQPAVASVAEHYFKDLLGTSNSNSSYMSMHHTIDSMHCNVIPDHKLNALTDFVSPDLIFKTL